MAISLKTKFNIERADITVPKKKVLNLYVDRDIHSALRFIAIATGISLKDLVVHILSNYVVENFSTKYPEGITPDMLSRKISRVRKEKTLDDINLEEENAE